MDNTAPTITIDSAVSDNADTSLAKVGDTVTVTFTTDGTEDGAPTATILGNAASVSNTSGNEYTATYTLVDGDAEGSLSFEVTGQDAAGNSATSDEKNFSGTNVTVDTTISAVDLAEGETANDSAVDFVNAQEAVGNASQSIAPDLKTPATDDYAQITVQVSGDAFDADSDVLSLDQGFGLNSDINQTNESIGGVSGVDYSFDADTATLSLTPNGGTFTATQVKDIVSGINFSTSGAEGARQFDIQFTDAAGNTSDAATQTLLVQNDISATVYARPVGSTNVDYLAVGPSDGIRADEIGGVDLTAIDSDEPILNHYDSQGNSATDTDAEIYLRVDNDTDWDWVFVFEKGSGGDSTNYQLSTNVSGDIVDDFNEHVAFEASAGDGVDDNTFVTRDGEVVGGLAQLSQDGGNVSLDGSSTAAVRFAAIKIDESVEQTNSISGSAYGFADVDIEIHSSATPSSGSLITSASISRTDWAEDAGGHGTWAIDLGDFTNTSAIDGESDFYVVASMSADQTVATDRGVATQVSGPLRLDAVAPDDVDLVSGGGVDTTATGFVNAEEAASTQTQSIAPNLGDVTATDVNEIRVTIGNVESGDKLGIGVNADTIDLETDTVAGFTVSGDAADVIIQADYDPGTGTLSLKRDDDSNFGAADVDEIVRGISFQTTGSDGDRTFSIEYVDDAGNTSASATQTLTVDQTDPVITGEQLLWLGGQTSVQLTAQDVQLDADSWVDDSSIADLTLSGDGTATFGSVQTTAVSGDFTVTDEAGNSVTSEVTFTPVSFAVFDDNDDRLASYETFTEADTAASSDEVIKIAGLSADDSFSLSGSDNVSIDASQETNNLELTGNSGSNNLTGGDGEDIITGGQGSDDLAGGGGDDTFVYNADAELTSNTLTGGSGTDSVRLDTAGTYDFSDIISANGIERLVLADDSAGFDVSFDSKLVDSNLTIAGDGGSGAALTQDVSVDASSLSNGSAVTVDGDSFTGSDDFAGGGGSAVDAYEVGGKFEDYDFSFGGTPESLTISDGNGESDSLTGFEKIVFSGGSNALIVGAGGYADVAAALEDVADNQILLLSQAESLTVSQADAIGNQSLTVEGVTLDTIADGKAALEGADFSANGNLAGYTTIENTETGTVATLDASDFADRSVTLAGSGDIAIQGTVADLIEDSGSDGVADAAIVSDELLDSASELILSDTAQNIRDLATDEIAVLVDMGLDVVEVSDGNALELDITQTRAFAGDPDAAAIDVTTGAATFDAGGVTLPAFTYVASAADDTLTGTSGDDDGNLDGGAGDDVINAGDGSDALRGGDGADTLNGGAGADTLVGGAGNDDLDGGAGVDTAVFSGRYEDYTITYQSGELRVRDDRLNSPDGTDDVVNVEKLEFQGDGETIRVVGAGGYESILAAAQAADSEDGTGDRILLESTESVTVEEAALIDANSLIFNDDALGTPVSTLEDTADNLTAALSGENAIDLNSGGYQRFTTIRSEDGESIDVAIDATTLGDKAVNLENGNFIVTGDIPAVENLDQVTTTGDIDKLIVSDSSTDLANLSDTAIRNLRNQEGVDEFIGDGPIELTAAQIRAFSVDANTTLLNPNGTVTLVGNPSSAETLQAFSQSDTGYSLLNDNSSDGDGVDGQRLDGRGRDDRIEGTTGTDLLQGGDGDDYIIGGGGADQLQGGAGDDLYFFSPNNVVTEAADAGIDEIRTTLVDEFDDSNPLPDNVENLRYVAGSENNAGPGTVDFTGVGNELDNAIYGGSGNDTLKGLGGSDILFGGAGEDVLDGGAGDDRFIVGTDQFSDQSDPYLGRQFISGSPADYASDEIIGGTGFDTLQFQGDADNDDFAINTTTVGIERVVLLGEFRTETLLALEIDASQYGQGTGNYDFTDNGSFTPKSVSDSGAFGNESLEGDNTSVTIDGLEIVGSNGANTITGTEFGDWIAGEDGSDDIYGGSGDDVVFGGAGDDKLFGEAGDDLLVGSAGDDRANGGSGDDVFIGGAGSDYFDGGAGSDTVVVDAGSTITITGETRFTGLGTVTATNSSGDKDTFEKVEAINRGGTIKDGALDGGDTVDVSNLFRVFTADGDGNFVNLDSAHSSFDEALSYISGQVTDASDMALVLADQADVTSITGGSLTEGLTILGSGTDAAGTISTSLDIDADGVTLQGVNVNVSGGEAGVRINANDVSIRDVTFTHDGGTIQSGESVAGADTAISFAGPDVTGLNVTDSDFSNFPTTIDFGDDFNGTAAVTNNAIDGRETGVRFDGLTANVDVTLRENAFTGSTTAVSFTDAEYDGSGSVQLLLNRFSLADGESGVVADVALPAGYEDSLGQTLLTNTFTLVGDTPSVTKTDIAGITGGDDLALLLSADDSLDGSSGGGVDVIRLSDADDEFDLSVANVDVGGTIIGGGGNDTVTFDGNSGDFTVTRQGNGDVSVSGGGTTTTLRGVETVDFTGSGDAVTFGSATITVAGDTGVSAQENATVISRAIDAALQGDNITLGTSGSGDFNGAEVAISADSLTIALDDAQNLTLVLSAEAGVSDFTLTGTAGAAGVTLIGNDDEVNIDASAVSGNLTIQGGVADDTLRAGSGDDTLVLASGGGNDSVFGGDGSDTAVFSSASRGLTLDLTDITASGDDGAIDIDGDGNIDDYVTGDIGDGERLIRIAAEGDPLESSVQNITGTNQADKITGDDQANRIEGLDGDDTILGGGGDDDLTGGGGSDTIEGGSGDDVIRGGAGDDRLFGGAGDDVLESDDDTSESSSERDGSPVGDDIVAGGTGNDTYNVSEVKGDENYFIGGSGDDTAAFERNIDQYYINRADSLAEFYNMMAGRDPNDLSLNDYAMEATEPLVRVDYLFDDGSRQTDYVQAENLQFADVTLNYGTLQELSDDAGNGFALSELESSELDLADYDGIDFYTASDSNDAVTWLGGGEPDSLYESNYVVGSSAGDTFVGSDKGDVFFGRAGEDDITGGLGADEVDGGEGADDYFLTPTVKNDPDGDNTLGGEFESGDRIVDSGTGSGEVDEVYIVEGGTVNFTVGDLINIEEVLLYGQSVDEQGNESPDKDSVNRTVIVDDVQFDDVDDFRGGDGFDTVRVNFTENGTTDSGTAVDGETERVILDTNTDGTGGTNRIGAENISTDTTVYVRGDATNDRLQVDDLQSTLDANGISGLNPYDGELDVNVKENATGPDGNGVSILTGSDNTTVTTKSGSAADINARYLTGDLDLDGSGPIRVTQANSIKIDASNPLGFDGNDQPLTGELDIAVRLDKSVDVITGTNNTKVDSDGVGTADIDAALMADNRELDLDGSSNFVVTNIQANVDATDTTDNVDITTAESVGDDEVIVETGTASTQVTGTGAGDNHIIEGDLLGTDATLTVDGDSNFTLNDIGSSVTVDANGDESDSSPSPLQGTLVVNTDPGATDVRVETGVGETTVNTETQTGGDVTIDAAELPDALSDTANLTINGAAAATVTDFIGTLNADGMTDGTLRVTTGDNTTAGGDGRIDLTVGDTDAVVDTTGASDAVHIDAAGMTVSGSDTLELAGQSDVVVTGLVRDLEARTARDADGVALDTLSGDLTVTTGNLQDPGPSGTPVEFTIGTGATSITANEDPDNTGANIDLTLEAEALTAELLTLDGDAEVRVNDLSTNVDAAALEGGLDINAKAEQGALTVDTGSGRTELTGNAGTTLNVNAANLSQGTGDADASEGAAELVVDGADGTVNITELTADVHAEDFGGALTLTTVGFETTGGVSGTGTGADNKPALEVVTGSGPTTINGADIDNTNADDGQIVDIKVDASAMAAPEGTQETLTLNGDAEYRVINNGTGVITLDIESIGDDTKLFLEGTGDFELTNTQADIDASALSGKVTVRTLDDDAKTEIEVTAGTGDVTVDAVDSEDVITLDATNITDDGDDVRNTNIETGTTDNVITDTNEIVAEGAGSVVINKLAADVDASELGGTVTANVAQIGTDQIDDVDIILGAAGGIVDVSGATQNSGAFVDASAVTTGDVNIRGDNENVLVAGVGDDVLVNANEDGAFGGDLEVETADGATGVEVRTGSGLTSVSSDNGSATVEAEVLNAELTLLGSSDITVNNLETDLVAGGTSGEVTVNTDGISGTSLTSAAMDITAGSGRLVVNGTDSGNETPDDNLDITIDASFLADGVVDTDDDGVIETADADLVLTGDTEYEITNTEAGEEVTIDASGLSASGDLTLLGDGDFNLINTTEDVTAPDLAGELTVTTKQDSTADAITVTAGSGILTANAVDAEDEITVQSDALVDLDSPDDELANGGNATSDDFEMFASGDGDVIFEALSADVDASSLNGTLTATIAESDIEGFSEDVDIKLNSADSTINTNGIGATLDATEVGTGDTVSLTQSGDVGIFNAGPGMTVDGGSDYSGELTVLSTVDAQGETLTVNTGTANTTVEGANEDGLIDVDATALNGLSQLTIDGETDVDVASLKSDVVATNSNGFIDIETDTGVDIVVTAGNGSMDITGYSGAVEVDANAIDGNTDPANTTDGRLSLDGAADFTVNNVEDDVTVDADGIAADELTGELTVNLADGATGVEVLTGSGDTNVDTGASASGDVVVEADELADTASAGDPELTLTGAGTATVNDLIADADASGLSGELTVTTGDNDGDGIIDITLGDASALIDGTASDDTVKVNATAMATDGDLLSLTGGSDFEVTGLSEDLTADADGQSTLVGTLTATTAELGDDESVNITLGSGSSTLTVNESDTNSGGAVEAFVDASAMTGADAKLTLIDDGEVRVTDASREVDAGALTGDLDLDSTTGADFLVTAGTGATEITSAENSDLEIDAGLIDGDDNTDGVTYELLVDGAGEADVRALEADLDASGLGGTLDVVTATGAVVDIKAGSGNSLIEAVGADSEVTVSAANTPGNFYVGVEGSGDFIVNDVGDSVFVNADGQNDQSVLQGTLTVNLDDSAAATVNTGVAATQVTGDNGSATINADELENNAELTVSGSSDMEVNSLKGDVVTDAATGTLTVETVNETVSDGIRIETSETTTDITANDRDTTVTVDATDLKDDELLDLSGESTFEVVALKGNLVIDSISSDPTAEAERTLDVTLADADDIRIDTARNGTVDADALSGTSTLELEGTGDLIVNNTIGDIDASAGDNLLGELVVNTNAVTGSSGFIPMTITTGEGSTTVNGMDGDPNDVNFVDIQVNATALADADNDTALKLRGSAEYQLVNDAAADGTNKAQVDLSEAGGDNGPGTIELTGQGEYDLIKTSTNIEAVDAEGPVTVTTRADAADDIRVDAGSGDLTVDAENGSDLITVGGAALVDDDDDDEIDGTTVVGNTDGSDDGNADDVFELTAEGAGDVTVEALAADLDASTLEGFLTVTVQAAGDFAQGAINDIDIRLNTGSSIINTLDADSSDVTLDAAAMDGGTVELDGAGDAEIFGINAGNTVDAQSGDFAGELDVFSAGLSAGESFTVKTGTNATTVDSDGGTAKIEANDLSDDASGGSDSADLTLRGSSLFSITALSADVMADQTTGGLDIETAEDAGSDDASGEVRITTGSGDADVTGTGASGFVRVDADGAAGIDGGSGDTITLDGAATFVVDNVGTGVTIDAASGDEGTLAGQLTVNAEDSASDVVIKTGASETIVNADNGGFEVDASAMVDDETLANRRLDLNGSSAAVVTGLVGEADAGDLTGSLTITTADNQVTDDVTVLLGTGTTSIASFAGDEVDVDATKAPDDQVVTLTGAGNFAVSDLVGDIDADGAGGQLVAELANPAGSGDITIDSDRLTEIGASQLEAEDTLFLAGSGDIEIVDETGSRWDNSQEGIRTELIDASSSTGAITVNTAAISGDSSVNINDTLFDLDRESASRYEEQAYMKIIAGSGDLTVNGEDAQDESDVVDIFVDSADAGGMDSDDILTLSGTAEYYLDDVRAVVRASENPDSLEGFTDKDENPNPDEDEANFPVNPNDGKPFPPDNGGIDSNLQALAQGDLIINGADDVDNVILGGAGSDRIDGGGGADILRGADGDDFIIGGDGADDLYGGDGNDLLYGGSGEDGGDFISGGDGFDTAMFLYTTSTSFDNGQPGGDITLAYGTDGRVLTEAEYKDSSVTVDREYLYSFDRNDGGVNGATQVEVTVTITDSATGDTYTDRVLRDVEQILFVQPDETPDPDKGQLPTQFSAPVINVDTGDRYTTIQGAVDDASVGDRILVTPTDYNEEAFVDKDLQFFIQSGTTGVTLSVDENYEAGDDTPDLQVLSEVDITLNGNSDGNEIVVLREDEFKDQTPKDPVQLKEPEGDSTFLELGEYGNIFNFDAASYTINGGAGDDTLAVSPDSAQDHQINGGSGNDFLSGGQAQDWMTGGAGDDIIITHGGDDSLLGGSGNDQLILATRADGNAGENGYVLVLPGGGEDDIVTAALDSDQGIDIDAMVMGYTRGDDRIDFGQLRDGGGSTVDLNDLINDSSILKNGTFGAEIDLSQFSALVEDGNGQLSEVSADGDISLLMVSANRLTASDLGLGSDTQWRDDFESALSAANMS
ncbi:hypothetical protein A6K26_009480 [Gammaproteobacteria bacterium 2W06]|nr:hypothetical protein A6K26_009480 [Gammaproteobacteria bacterium 2W06]